MSKAGLLKTTLVWGAVGAGVTLTGLASTGHLLPTASAGGQGATAAAPASSGPGEVPIVATDVSVGDASGGGQPAAGVPAGPTPGYAPTAAAGAAPPDARNLPSPNTTSAAAPDGRAIPSSTEGQPPTPVAGSGAMMGEMMAPSTTEGRPQPPRIINYKSQSINEQRIHDALTRPVEFQFNGQTLGQVLQFIESVENVRIRLDEVALQDEGVGADSEINLAINGVSLENALNLMFESVNGVRLDYVIKNDVLTITTATKAENMIETRVYDVRNFDGMTPESLARVITHSVRPESWAMTVAETRELAETRKFLKANRGVSGGHGGAGAMSGMAGYPMGMGGGSPPPEEETPGHLGGGNGWIEPIGGALVITQSQVVHREIVELLEQLSRYAQASDGEAAPGMGQGGAGMSGMYGSMGGRRGSASGYGGAGSSPYGGSAYPTSGAQPRGSSPAPAYGAPAANPPGVAPQPATQPQEELPAASPQTSGRSPGSVYPGSSGTPAPSADPAAPTPDGAELPASRQK